jgi:hypothetical protein
VIHAALQQVEGGLVGRPAALLPVRQDGLHRLAELLDAHHADGPSRSLEAVGVPEDDLEHLGLGPLGLLEREQACAQAVEVLRRLDAEGGQKLGEEGVVGAHAHPVDQTR